MVATCTFAPFLLFFGSGVPNLRGLLLVRSSQNPLQMVVTESPFRFTGSNIEPFSLQRWFLGPANLLDRTITGWGRMQSREESRYTVKQESSTILTIDVVRRDK